MSVCVSVLVALFTSGGLIDDVPDTVDDSIMGVGRVIAEFVFSSSSDAVLPSTATGLIDDGEFSDVVGHDLQSSKVPINLPSSVIEPSASKFGNDLSPVDDVADNDGSLAVDVVLLVRLEIPVERVVKGGGCSVVQTDDDDDDGSMSPNIFCGGGELDVDNVVDVSDKSDDFLDFVENEL